MVNLPPAFRERLSARFEILGPFDQHPSAALTPEQAGRVTAVVTFGSQVSDAPLFDALPNLKLLCCWGTGFERVDLAARSEERRVGKECVSTCRSRWSPVN